MGNRFNFRLSSLFRNRFRSCQRRSRIQSDAIEKPILSLPICQKTANAVRNCIVTRKTRLSDPKKLPADMDIGLCPPVSPVSEKTKQPKKSILKNGVGESNNVAMMTELDSGNFSSGAWSDGETETLFSSKSTTLSSESPVPRRRGYRSGRKMGRKRVTRIRPPQQDVEVSVNSSSSSKVGESFAVAKRSRDPYSDFRASMVEMVVEKQIFAAPELEQLLQCFLSLNESRHHGVIVEVFTEIWEALFYQQNLSCVTDI